MSNKEQIFKSGDFVKVGWCDTPILRGAHGVVVGEPFDETLMWEIVTVRLAGFNHNSLFYVENLELVARAE